METGISAQGLWWFHLYFVHNPVEGLACQMSDIEALCQIAILLSLNQLKKFPLGFHVECSTCVLCLFPGDFLIIQHLINCP